MIDTNYTIFGYTWEDIQARQMKRYAAPSIDPNSPLPTATDKDRELLAQHGSIDALRAAGLMGVVDRLSRDPAVDRAFPCSACKGAGSCSVCHTL